MKLIKSLIVLSVVLMLLSCSDATDEASKPREVLLQGLTMGTVVYNVKLIIKPQDSIVNGQQKFERGEVHAEIETILKQLNQDMSNWVPDSELSRFNNSTSLEPIEISSGLSRVIAESLRLGKLSNGKLDVTVGPLVNLWGFGPEQRPERVPTDEEFVKAKARVGLQYLTLSGNQLTKAIPNLYIDLSTIAKGYAVDLIAEAMERRGINNYLVEVGGEMRVKGFKHTGELWAVAIEKPITDERLVHQVIVPRDNALATSGDYRKYFEADGQRFSHIIDPDTGKPINHKLVSVTVIHPSSMTADGLSTAMMVMGEDKAYKFAMENDIAAYIISKTDNGFKEKITVKFMPYLK
ncbi:MAG: FAD:protein FMN transferase [Colwellia sp.]|nr:FAD:protein FMN transferase [Colwellia sp.]